MQLLVRNRVADFKTWLEAFDADRERAAGFGLAPAGIWQSKDDPNEVFFLLDVEDVDRADAFMAQPESRAVGQKAGVIDGDFHYIRRVMR